MTDARILSGLLIATAVSCTVVFAQDNLRISNATGQQPVEFAQHGNTTCALVNNNISCVQAVTRASIKLASFVSK